MGTWEGAGAVAVGATEGSTEGVSDVATMATLCAEDGSSLGARSGAARVAAATSLVRDACPRHVL